MSDPDDYWSKATQDRWFFAALLASTVSVAWLFWPYAFVLMFAAVTVVVCWPVYTRLLRWTGGRALLASSLTTLLLGLLVFVPLAFIIYLFALEVQAVSQYAIELVQSGELERLVDDWLSGLELPEAIQPWLPALPELPELPALPGTGGGDTDTDVLEALPPEWPGTVAEGVRARVEGFLQVGPEALGSDMASEVLRERIEVGLAEAVEPVVPEAAASSGNALQQIVARLGSVEGELFQGAQDAALGALSFAGERVPGVLQAAVDLSIDSVIYVFAVITLFTQGERVLVAAKRLSPMDDRYEERLFDVFGEFSRNLVVGSVATAAIQGVVAGIGYAVSGLENVIFLAILTGIGSFVPVVGTVVVWVPVVLYLVVTGDYGYAIFLATWSLAVVGTIDNVLKPLFMRGNTDIHPLLVFLAVFGGLYWLGLPGLLVGPVLVAFFLALYTIYARDFLGLEVDALSVDQPEGWVMKLVRRGFEAVGLGGLLPDAPAEDNDEASVVAEDGPVSEDAPAADALTDDEDGEGADARDADHDGDDDAADTEAPTDPGEDAPDGDDHDGRDRG